MSNLAALKKTKLIYIIVQCVGVEPEDDGGNRLAGIKFVFFRRESRALIDLLMESIICDILGIISIVFSMMAAESWGCFSIHVCPTGDW